MGKKSIIKLTPEEEKTLRSWVRSGKIEKRLGVSCFMFLSLQMNFGLSSKFGCPSVLSRA